ncbi:MAG TPA: hypothetical protein VFG14_13895 [Chthoniobacteraceae bacterium]|nr:hypothetical protein [Chthoniobacteraceae bacterium]
MCAAFELNSRMIRPGRWVGVWRERGDDHQIWAGFARREILGWWKKKGGELVDIPAHRFAERSELDRQLRWDEVPAGLVIRGIIDPHDGKPLLRVLTRASTQEEQIRFQHPRMPVLEPPLYNFQPVPPRREDADNIPTQGELF